MGKKVLTEGEINQDYIVYYYKMGYLKKLIFATEEVLKSFIKDDRNYDSIDDIYIKGQRVYFKKETIVELIYQ